jgi:hypothetical protein
MSVHCDGVGEVIFNSLDPTTHPIASLAGSGVLAPDGLPDGNGYHVNFVGGNDGAPIRNPITNRPHTHGTIPHTFRRSGTIVQIDGDFIVTKPQYRKVLADSLRSVLEPSLLFVPWLTTDRFRFLWTPPGQGTRYREGKLHDKLVITGSDANPKGFSFSMFFERPEALGLAGGSYGAGVVPNNGNTDTFPVVHVSAGAPFTLDNGTHQVKWGKTFIHGGPAPISGSYIEVDMLRQTMVWDTGENALGRIYMPDSDFFTIPPGGATISCDAGVTVISHDGWVG